jgi:hypothetical protein
MTVKSVTFPYKGDSATVHFENGEVVNIEIIDVHSRHMTDGYTTGELEEVGLMGLARLTQAQDMGFDME